MGQELTRRDLAALGDAAVRFLRLARSEDFAEPMEAVIPFVDALIESRGDSRGLTPAAPFVSGVGMFSPDLGEWGKQVWTTDERDHVENGGAGWYLSFGRRSGFEGQDAGFYERVAQLGMNPTGHHAGVGLQLLMPGGDPFAVGLQPEPSPIPLLRLLNPPPELRTQSREEMRKMLQGLAALYRHPRVVVDVSWEPRHVRESLMAQIAEWLTRGRQGRDPDGGSMCPWCGLDFVQGVCVRCGPELAEDVLAWWARWASRVARRRVDTTEVYEVARFTVPPDRPDGHYSYWKKSLHPKREDDLATRAAARLGISRRTVFNRLRRGELKLSDFASEPDPPEGPRKDRRLRALCNWLQQNAPPTRRVPDSSRKVLEALEERGLSHEYARKLERRTRTLPQEEQKRRLMAAMSRYRRRPE